MPPTKKAAASKKTAAKKAPATKKAAKTAPSADDAVAERRAAKEARNAELTDEIVAGRENNESWFDISQRLGIGQGAAMYLYMIYEADQNKKIQIKWSDLEDLGAKVREARDNEALSWGQISARTRPLVGESRCRSAYEAAGGDLTNNRIGRGGRYAVDSGERPAKKAGATKKAGKTEPTKVSGTELAKMPLSELTLPQMQARLNGRAIKVAKKDGGHEVIKVGVVKKLKDGAVSLFDTDKKARTVMVENITGVSK